MPDAMNAAFDSEPRLSRRRFIGGTTAIATAVATPIFAQQFFDVPFVPTPQVVVDEMLRLAAVGAKDVVHDLGSGDGRIVITAASKFGARGVGVELNEHLIYQSEASAQQANVESRVKFLQQDFFKTDFSEASVVTLYLLPAVMKRLRERMLQLKPGTRLVAHDFDFDDWRPDVKTTIRKNTFLWIVPARVGGRWQTRVELPREPFAFQIDVRQKHQDIDGIVKIEGRRPAACGKRSSRAIASASSWWTAATAIMKRAQHFDGRVTGDTMRAKACAASATWRSRASRGTRRGSGEKTFSAAFEGALEHARPVARPVGLRRFERSRDRPAGARAGRSIDARAGRAIRADADERRAGDARHREGRPRGFRDRPRPATAAS